MIFELMTAAAALLQADADPAGLEAVGGLSGCWNAPGYVRGEAVQSIAKGEWHFAGRYFLLQLHSTSGERDYSAAIIYGAGQQPNTIGSYWLDTFGGTAPLPVDGAATADGFIVEYHFPDSVFTNRFTRLDEGWRWTILEQPAGQAPRMFAEYILSSTTCDGLTFEF